MGSPDGGQAGGPLLTRREREVLVELCRPMLGEEAFTEPSSIKQIASALFVSDAAVKQHLLHLYDKFAVYDDAGERRRVRLANEAVRRGVVSPADLGAADVAGAPASLDVGREAVAAGAWQEAFMLLTEAASAGQTLTPGELEGLGEAAIWTGHHDESVAARQAAHAAYVKADDQRGAARVALGLVINNHVRLNASVAAGWFNKARRHLADEPEAPEHGWLACTAALGQLDSGALDAALESARQAFGIGQRLDQPDLVALGMTFEGFALVHQGKAKEGLALLDEAMASASAGELGPLATGIAYCRTMCACFDLLDYRRALDWGAAIGASESRGAAGFAGDCRAHRAAVLIAQGEWVEGEEEAKTACAESEAFDLHHSGLATYELGELRLRLGELDEAERFFCRAQDLGMFSQPGLALLHLARGDLMAARASIEGALAEVSADELARARFLPAAVEIELASGQLDQARAAADALAELARRYDSAALPAASACATGAVALSQGDAATASSELRRGYRLWRQAEAPYEAARARLGLAEALAAEGDAAGSRHELDAAREQLQRLGARPDVARAEALLLTMRG